MIRVCLVEDQTLVRQGIQTLLEMVDDIDVVAQAKESRSVASVETIWLPSSDADPYDLR